MEPKAFQEYEERAAVLEAVAARYGAHSKEYETVKLAALALFFVAAHHSAEFSSLQASLEKGLTAEDSELLRRFGIDANGNQ